jgi:two-component system chemotaxis response regulator CheB
VLFRSAALAAGKNAVGVILTGMGKDGALGMLEMKQAGAYNFAQDEASSVVFGMPREAIAVGATHEVGALKALPEMVLNHLATNSSRALRV